METRHTNEYAAMDLLLCKNKGTQNPKVVY